MNSEIKPLNIVVGENLTRILNERGLGVREFASLVDSDDITAASVSLWCLGKSMPRPKNIDKICEALHIDRIDLINEPGSVLNLSKTPFKKLPILGTICAGDGVIAEQDYDGYYFVDWSVSADYCLKVIGDSMEGAQIYDGDIAFIKSDFNFTEGNIYGVVFGYENKATLKRVFKSGDKYTLIPCNEKYESITIDENEPFFIVGELVGTYHRWR